MDIRASLSASGRPGLAALILVQIACALFFVGDAVGDVLTLGPGSLTDPIMIMEIIASGALVGAVWYEIGLLRSMVADETRKARSLRVAQGALSEVVDGYFKEWALTPAEEEVALYTLKGCDIAEIARLRGGAEGTVKAHLSAIYRKAGVPGRSGLLALMIEDLMGAPLLAEPRGETGATSG